MFLDDKLFGSCSFYVHSVVTNDFQSPNTFCAENEQDFYFKNAGYPK